MNIQQVLASATLGVALVLSTSEVHAQVPSLPEEYCNDLKCTREYKPVCSSDGTTFTTYSNYCQYEKARCANPNVFLQSLTPCVGDNPMQDHHQAEAATSCTRHCTEVYLPVCGSNQKTYTNQCHLENAQCEDASLQLLHEGECPYPQPRLCGKMCVMVDAPVCGSDTKTYSNQCALENAQCDDESLGVAHEGKCKQQRRMRHYM